MKLVITFPFQPESYNKLLASCNGDAKNVFLEIGQAITKRYFEQIESISPSKPFLDAFLETIWDAAHTEGLPTPLQGQEMGEAAEQNDEYLKLLTDQCFEQIPKNRAEDNLRPLCLQLLVTLLSPEFKSCRQSYIDEEPMGGCIRQDSDHCKDRISGSHCEDCPYFTALTAHQHRKLLSRVWSPDSKARFESAPQLFLPEDFRSLRIFWHLHLRYRVTPKT